jgi:hypothetical protein
MQCHLQDAIINRGLSAIQSTCFYLDWDFPWTEAYTHDVLHPECGSRSFLTDTPLLLGAEVCVWTERIDRTNFFCRAWPRVASYAERWWRLNPSVSVPLDYGASNGRPPPIPPPLRALSSTCAYAALKAHGRLRHFVQVLQSHGVMAANIRGPQAGSDSGGVCPLLPEQIKP